MEPLRKDLGDTPLPFGGSGRLYLAFPGLADSPNSFSLSVSTRLLRKMELLKGCGGPYLHRQGWKKGEFILKVGQVPPHPRIHFPEDPSGVRDAFFFVEREYFLPLRMVAIFFFLRRF